MSPVLRLSGAGFAHRPDVPLLADVDLHLAPGFTAVVGPNGAGKTTLLRLLAGELRPTAGHRSGPERVHLCPQEVRDPDDAVRAFAWGWAGDGCWALQSRLGLDPSDLDRWPTLSAGERKRWQIGAALAAEPEALLLDEPTNHLDAETRAVLLEALGEYRGIGVVVSHDRVLLRALAGAVVRVEGGSAVLFPGSWDQARAQWDRDRLALERAADQADREARAARHRLAEARRAAAGAEAHRSVRSRAKGPKDSDARSIAVRARAEKAAARASRRVTVERRRSGEAEAGRVAIRDPLGGALRFAAAAGRARLGALRLDALCAGERALLRDVDLWIDAGDKIWIRGPNGAGKSTLLAALRAVVPEDGAVWLPQELDGQEVLAELHALPPEARGRVLQAVAALGVDPGPLLASGALSPGEARKLRIALGLGTRAALLVLDEPTNHLDLPSVERLQTALRGFEGAVLLVTHDPDLGESVAERVWTLRDGRVDEDRLAPG